MTEAEKLREAQGFIAREVQKKGAGRIDAMHGEQTPHDQTNRIHQLVVFRGGEKSIFTFTEFELLEDFGLQTVEKAAAEPHRRNSNGVLRWVKR